MWEYSCKPSKACAGFVKTSLFKDSFAMVSEHIPGCLGVPLFSGKCV